MTKLTDERIDQLWYSDPNRMKPATKADLRFAHAIAAEVSALLEARVKELEAALRDVLDFWHGGHLIVRDEAKGAWNAAVESGERAIAQGEPK